MANYSTEEQAVIKQSFDFFDKDKDEILSYKEIEEAIVSLGAALTISRFKGLGEMSTEQLEETTMSKDNRILKQIDVSDIALCEKVVQNLMGEQVGPRRDFIAANAHKANIDL